MDFPDLAEDDLDLWNGDLAKALSQMPSADTIFFPFGTYKNVGGAVKMGFL